MAPERQMITAFAPEDLTQQALIEAILRESSVPYLTRNVGVQNLFGVGQIGGFNFATGPIEILVPRAELERARELVANTLEDSVPEAELEEAPDTKGHVEIQPERAVRYSRFSVVWAMLGFGGLGSLIAIHLGIRALLLLRESPATSKNNAVFGVTAGVIGLPLWFIFWHTILRT